MLEENQLLFARSTERITGKRMAGSLRTNMETTLSGRIRSATWESVSPVIPPIGSDHSITSASNGQGYMKLGPQNRLAVALSDAGKSNVVEIFDFDNTTGEDHELPNR